MKIASYNEFWLFYVSEHMKKETRIWHALGTTVAVVVLVAAIVTDNWWLLLLAPLAGYGPAWFSHFVIEKNRPATFKYPMWSLRADCRMYGLVVTGKMQKELEKAEIWRRSQLG
jgi:hypothetical protein